VLLQSAGLPNGPKKIRSLHKRCRYNR